MIYIFTFALVRVIYQYFLQLLTNFELIQKVSTDSLVLEELRVGAGFKRCAIDVVQVTVWSSQGGVLSSCLVHIVCLLPVALLLCLARYTSDISLAMAPRSPMANPSSLVSSFINKCTQNASISATEKWINVAFEQYYGP